MPRPPYRNRLGSSPNEGALLLWRALRSRELTPLLAAKTLNVGSGLISRWLFCDGKPGRALAEKVLEEFGIPIVAWDVKVPAKSFDLPALRASRKAA